jgi:hypothetical protein
MLPIIEIDELGSVAKILRPALSRKIKVLLSPIRNLYCGTFCDEPNDIAHIVRGRHIISSLCGVTRPGRYYLQYAWELNQPCDGIPKLCRKCQRAIKALIP